MIDPQRYPRLASYLACVPAGTDSHPQARAKGLILSGFVDARTSELARASDLPDPIKAALANPPGAFEWVPEVVTLASIVAAADLLGLDEAGWREWQHRKNLEVFGSGVLRVLMSATSPSRILSLAGAYWRMVREGTSIRTLDADSTTARLALHYPDRLYDRLLAESECLAFGAALELSNAKDPVVELESLEPTCAVYRARWS